MEGLVRGQSRAPLLVFGKPSEEAPRVEYALGIPGMLSWMAFDDPEVRIEGIEDYREAGHPTPPFVVTFVSFHTMVGLGLLFVALMALGIVLLLRKKLYDTSWYLKLLIWSIPVPLIAIELGWIVAEVGRQPWVVYRLLKTEDAYSANVTGGEVLFSIIMFGLVYLALGALYLFTLIRKIKHGPAPLPVKEAGR
jgi:cytochrome d ubiquinol oxidase subunit I